MKYGLLNSIRIREKYQHTSQVMSLPDLVTPIFWVRPRETWKTSVFNMGRRRGVEMPLPQVYTEDSGNGCIIFVEVKPDSPPSEVE